MIATDIATSELATFTKTTGQLSISESTAKKNAATKNKTSQVKSTADFVAIMGGLRSKAEEHHERYEVQGRKAVLRLVAEVNAQHNAAVKHNRLDKVIAELKEKLIAEDRAVPSKSTDCAVLIRYIFKDFTPKQVCQYSRSIEIAHSKAIEPDDFISFVESAGGFEKLCANNPVSGKASGGGKKVEVALSMLKNAHAEQTITVDDWVEGEAVRIYIGILGDAGEVNLVNTKLSEAAVNATLERYRIENDTIKKEKAEKAKREKEIELMTSLLAALENRKPKLELKALKAKEYAENAKKGPDEINKQLALIRLKDAEDELQELEREIQETQAKLDA